MVVKGKVGEPAETVGVGWQGMEALGKRPGENESLCSREAAITEQ